MIKFFRRIRQSLLKENRVGKYLLYALGEIILVVIGILIALAINDAYNASKNEQKIKTILTQIQEDILVDIEDSRRIFYHYVRKDSTARNIYNNLVSVKTDAGELRPNEGYVNFSVNRGGYERLMDNLENLPEKYSVLLPKLNSIYVVTQDDINDANAGLLAAANDKQFNQAYTHPEHAEYAINNFSTEEGKQYLLDDPFLKNKTIEYMSAFSSVSMTANTFRIEATALYQQIDTLLGRQNTETTELPRLTPNKEFMESFLGEYTHFEGNEIFSNLFLKFENDLTFDRPDGRQVHLYWFQDYYFFNRRAGIFRFFNNEKGRYFLEISNGVRGQIMMKE